MLSVSRLRVVTLNVWNNRGDAATRIALINAELRRLEPNQVDNQRPSVDRLQCFNRPDPT